jgi:GTP-dependent dephospho-CoA kinase
MYRLPASLRGVFQEPFGPVMTTDELLASLPAGATIVAVGDVVSLTLINHGRRPKVIVIDYKTQRGDDDPLLRRILGSWGDEVVRVRNPAATITDELVAALKAALAAKGSTRIEVDGEEDLAGLPVFAHAPDGTIVLYGMPHRGVVRVVVDAQKRAMALDLLKKMRVE